MLKILSISAEEIKTEINIKLLKIFQNYSKVIFVHSKEFTTQIKERLLKTLKSKFCWLLPEEEFEKLFTKEAEELIPTDDVEEMLKSEDFEAWINILYTLCVNMILSDPPINIQLINFENFSNEEIIIWSKILCFIYCF